MPPASSVFAGTLVILRSRWQIARNTWWRGKLWRKAVGVLMLALVLLFSYGLYRVSRAIVRGILLLEREEPALLAQLGDLPRILAAVPSIVLTAATLPLLVSSISFALGTLYLARDLDLLLVSPVPRRSVFLARFVEGLLPIYLMLFALLLPGLVGYGIALNYGLAYAALLPLVLLLLPLLPISIGILLTMALVRIIPPQRLRELLAILGGLTGFLLYIGTQWITGGRRGARTLEAAEQLLQFDIGWLPSAWAARLLIATGNGNARLLLQYGVPYLLVTCGTFALTVALAERLYYQGWSGLAASAGGRVRRRTTGTRSQSRSTRGPTAVILGKDLRMLPRDPQRLSQLLVPLGLSIFWAWQLLGTRGARRAGESGVLATLTSIALFVCILVSSNLGLTGVSREGRGFWLLKIAPISPWPILWSKWVVAFLPFPVMGTLAAVLIGVLRRPPPMELLQAWAIVQMTGLGVSGIATGMGAAYARLDWTQAQRMTSIRAGCLSPILYYGYAAANVALTGGVSLLAPRVGTLVVVAGWAAAIILTLAALILPLVFAAEKLQRLEL